MNNGYRVPTHQGENRRVTTVLLLIMGGLLALIGWIILGAQGIALALGFGLGYLFLGFRASPAVVMRVLGAHKLTYDEAPGLHALVDAMCARAGLKKPPDIYQFPNTVMQSLTIGGGGAEAAVGVSAGLLRGLNLRELTGVLAHELGHIANRDLVVLRIADLVTGLTRSLAFVGLLLLVFNIPLYFQGGGLLPLGVLLLLIFAPLASTLIQLAVSRTREFAADERAAELAGESGGLISALSKIEADHGGELWVRGYLPQRRPPEPSALRSHPLTEERIQRLAEIRPANPPLPVDELVLPAIRARRQLVSPTVWRRFWPWF